MANRNRAAVWKSSLFAMLAVLMLSAPGVLEAAKISDVTNTVHNLSTTASSATRTVVASTESQICVFCHTPHAATAGAAPLWNRTLSSATYNMYSSNSVDAYNSGDVSNPGGSSKLCLSCHDGTIAIGNVNVANGVDYRGGSPLDEDIELLSGVVTMPDGSYGATSGFTRNLGKVLTNDHPISFTYNTAVNTADNEIRDPSAAANKHLGPRRHPDTNATLTQIPLEGYKDSPPTDGTLECISCHDPHIRDDSDPDIKFLRGNRLQLANPSGSSYTVASDIICLACHDKLGSDWANSAHANNTDALETYGAGAAFPSGTPVWQAACLNCHDTHTVQGARRLLREGTDSPLSPKTGGDSAIEETCYQCHSAGGGILTAIGNVPDIKTDFTTSDYTMPITREVASGGDQYEIHDIGSGTTWTPSTDRPGANMLESRERLGHAVAGDDADLPLANTTAFDYRHAECTDCHNPHRVIKSEYFSGGGTGTKGTHQHDSASDKHNNLISGVLKGAWGIEPGGYGSAEFYSVPTTFTVKKGVGAGTTVGSPNVTREYQICLKCHSNYAYNEGDLTTGNFNSGRPSLGTPGTPSGATERVNFSVYTNQAREFQAPGTSNPVTGHHGESGSMNLGVEGGASGNWDNENHRSWHPVMSATGRTKTIRSMNTGGNQFRDPWNSNSNVGSQTMYCTDCHGSNTGDNTVVPEGGDTQNAGEGNGLENVVNAKPWGPHGSDNRFLLKGTYSGLYAANDGAATRDLCLKCHNPSTYNGSSDDGGFMHGTHVDKIGRQLNCNWCHIAVPHGWKNKSLLVNLNDVGPEAGYSKGTRVRIGANNSEFSRGPYYRNAKLKIYNFSTAGNWGDNDCGNRGSGQVNPTSGNTGNNGERGKTWMTEVCQNPP